MMLLRNLVATLLAVACLCAAPMRVVAHGMTMTYAVTAGPTPVDAVTVTMTMKLADAPYPTVNYDALLPHHGQHKMAVTVVDMETMQRVTTVYPDLTPGYDMVNTPFSFKMQVFKEGWYMFGTSVRANMTTVFKDIGGIPAEEIEFGTVVDLSQYGRVWVPGVVRTNKPFVNPTCQGRAFYNGPGFNFEWTTLPNSCETYCDLADKYCTTDPQDVIKFSGASDRAACMSDCATFAKGNPGDATGNTLACRIYHISVAGDPATLSGGNKTVHCVEGRVAPHDPCVDEQPADPIYSMPRSIEDDAVPANSVGAARMVMVVNKDKGAAYEGECVRVQFTLYSETKKLDGDSTSGMPAPATRVNLFNGRYMSVDIFKNGTSAQYITADGERHTPTVMHNHTTCTDEYKPHMHYNDMRGAMGGMFGLPEVPGHPMYGGPIYVAHFRPIFEGEYHLYPRFLLDDHMLYTGHFVVDVRPFSEKPASSAMPTMSMPMDMTTTAFELAQKQDQKWSAAPGCLGPNPNPMPSPSAPPMVMVSASPMAGMSASPAVSDGTPTVVTVTNVGAVAYKLNDGADNAPMSLVAGQAYVFRINAPGHPFFLRCGESNLDESDGVVNNGVDSGDVKWLVPADFTCTNNENLNYVCSLHPTMMGMLAIVRSSAPKDCSGEGIQNNYVALQISCSCADNRGNACVTNGACVSATDNPNCASAVEAVLGCSAEIKQGTDATQLALIEDLLGEQETQCDGSHVSSTSGATATTPTMVMLAVAALFAAFL